MDISDIITFFFVFLCVLHAYENFTHTKKKIKRNNIANIHTHTYLYIHALYIFKYKFFKS